MLSTILSTNPEPNLILIVTHLKIYGKATFLFAGSFLIAAYDAIYHNDTFWEKTIVMDFTNTNVCLSKRAYQNSWALDASVGHWILDAGVWSLDPGCWTLDAGLWMLDSGRWALDPWLWTLGSGRWLWMLGSGRWALLLTGETSFWFCLMSRLCRREYVLTWLVLEFLNERYMLHY